MDEALLNIVNLKNNTNDIKKHTARIAVIGAGPVGLISAYLLLKKGFLVDIFDPFLFKAENSNSNHIENIAPKKTDLRYVSLNHGSICLLEKLGIDIANFAQKIETVHINTHRYWGACTMRAFEQNVAALAYSIHYQDLQAFLYQTLKNLAKNLDNLDNLEKNLNCIDEKVNINILNKNKQYQHIFTCEGGLFEDYKNDENDEKIKDIKPIKPIIDNHQQMAYIGFINLDNKHLPKNFAWECFTDEGPLALLPYHAYPNPYVKASHVLVWCKSTINTNDDAVLDDQKALTPAAGADLFKMLAKLKHFETINHADLKQAIQHIKWQQTHELGLRYLPYQALTSEQFKHVTPLGNAAQIMHPVAGQGLNLGLRQAEKIIDAFAIYIKDLEDLKDSEKPTNSEKSINNTYFKAYNQSLQCDRQQMIFLTTMMAKGFKIPLFSGIFTAGLQVLHSLPPLKKMLANVFMYGRL